MAGILVGNSSNNKAIGTLGFKGERGYSAYEIAVQHGYIGTEDEWLASKNEKWQDEGGVDVKFFKGDTEDIEDRAIIHGQLLYNTDSGETFLDYETNRINTGSGNVVAISDMEPANPATKLWIKPDEPLNNIGTEVVNSISGNETNMAPSVAAVKGYVEDALKFEVLTVTCPPNSRYTASTNIFDYSGIQGTIIASCLIAAINSVSNSNLNYEICYADADHPEKAYGVENNSSTGNTIVSILVIYK